MIFSCPIVEDSDGHQCIEFSDELMEKLDLRVGDVVQWELNGKEWSFRKEDRSE